jgi:prepilin-type N-terminal cleavage/methylation domain-containing protein
MTQSAQTKVTRAFTLIELLVVIAIIAILAAILFPVFAQAKEAAKKTKVLAEAKQLGSAMQIYLSDNDDVFPIMHPVDPATATYLHSANGIFSYRLAAVPAGWGANAAFRQADSVAWNNSIFPYSKNNDIQGGGGALTLYTSGFDYSTAPANLPVTAISGNGLLNTWSATAVNSPSMLPLLWFGNGREAYRGFAYTQPYLRCTQTGSVSAPAAPCIFNPGGRSQLNGSAARSREDTYEFTFNAAADTVQTFGNGNIIVRADSSAKFLRMGSNSQPEASATPTRAIMEPGFVYTSGFSSSRGASTPPGYVLNPMRCVSSAGAPHYQSMFRPDSSFSYGFGTTGDNAPCNIQ